MKTFIHQHGAPPQSPVCLQEVHDNCRCAWPRFEVTTGFRPVVRVAKYGTEAELINRYHRIAQEN